MTGPTPPPGAASAVRLDAGIQTLPGSDGRSVLLGGSPLRLLRLRPPADAIVESLQSGTSLDATIEALDPPRRAAGRRFVDSLVARGLAHPVPATNPDRRLDDVTVVIPVHNRAASLARLLESLIPLVARGLEVIVVDDGSTDDIATVAVEREAKVIRHDTARGPSSARNAGLNDVTTTFTAFLDSDVVPHDRWLDACLAHLDADPGTALVAPRIVGLADVTSADATAIERYEDSRSSLDLGPAPALIAPTTRVAYVPAAALVARTDVLRSVDGFDEALHLGEDVDLLWRLHGAGQTLRYEPLAEVAHDHRTALGAMLRRRMLYGTSAAALDARHPGLVPPAVLSPWSAAAWGLALVHPIGAVTGAGLAEATARQLPAKLPMLAPADARRLAWRGHLAAGSQLADAAIRTWFPLTAALALLPGPIGRRARVALVGSLVVQGLREHRRLKPRLGPVRFVALRALDDAAYGIGVWTGAVRQRSGWGALLPKLTNWPGRKNPEQDVEP